MAQQRRKSPLIKGLKNIGPKIPRPKVPGTNRRPNKSKTIV